MVKRKKIGKVFLIGSGPGDPGLLTLKGREILMTADLIVHDRLVNPEILKFARGGARLVDVGKRRRAGTGSQEEIYRIIIKAAREGSQVARLKGGDPFLFGRGGEDAEALKRAEIPFELIPGVSSALAAPGYAGIPLTHRQIASSVIILTGHENLNKDRPGIRWDRLAGAADTVVVLMAMKRLEPILDSLRRGGFPASTPAAVITWGTWPRQKVITAPLETLEAEVREAGLEAPGVLIVGDVVRLRDRLNWFENRPLHGVRVLVTRAADQAGPLRRELERYGAEVVEVPMIEIRPPARWKPFDDVLKRIERYDWLIFTSPNGVRFALDRLMEKGKDVRVLQGIRLAAIGPKTESTLRARGLRADRVPEAFRSEGLLRAFRPREISGKRILLPRGNLAGSWLPGELRKSGARVDQVEVYRTVRPRAAGKKLAVEVGTGSVQLVTFTSSSTVNHFARSVSPRKASELLHKATVACIGPVTADSARIHGIRTDVVSPIHTVPGLVSSIIAHYQDRKSGSRTAPAGDSLPPIP